jgi:micrococcal nuclease
MEVRMQNLIALAAIAMAVFETSAPIARGRLTRSESLLVRAVVDGNTIDVATIGHVRLLGIEAPRIDRGSDTLAPLAREARQRLTSLLLHRWVRLEHEGTAKDASNRHLAYVTTEDGQFVNAVLVREGLARVVARGPLTRLSELQRAEAEARASRRGMWATAGYTGRLKASRPSRPATTRYKSPSTRRRTTQNKNP